MPVEVGRLRAGKQALVSRYVPRTLTCCIRSKRLVVSSAVPRRSMALVLLIPMSTPPKRSTAAAAGASDVFFTTNITDDRQRLATGRRDRFCRGVDGPRQSRVWLIGLGQQHDIG